MTYSDLVEKVAAILPHASFGEDNEGQIVIYTNLREQADGSLVDMDEQA